MGKVLIVDDDESVGRLVTDIIRPLGHAVETFQDAGDALRRLESSPEEFGLIIADINMPRLDGFQFRERTQKNPSTASIPFVFLTGADESVERRLAERMSGEIVQFKPVNIPGLRRIVRSLLGDLEHRRGPFAADDLFELLNEIQQGQLNAATTFYRQDVVKKVYFQGGQLAFAISNDPSELIGQVLIRRGIISERGLGRLFEDRGSRSVPLGEVLVSTAAASAEQLKGLLENKIRDALLDVFLWDWGWQEVFFGGIEASEVAFAARLPLAGIVQEARKRIAIWKRLGGLLPADDAAFTVNEIPDSELSSTGDQLVAQLLKDGRSLADIHLEVRGQRFAVGVKIARWIQKGYVEPGGTRPSSIAPSRSMDEAFDSAVGSPEETPLPDGSLEPLPEPDTPASSPPAPPSSTPVAPLLGQALVAFREGRLHDSRDLLVEVLQLDPGNPLAHKRLEDIDQRLVKQAGDHGLEPEARLMFTGSMDDLPNRPLSFSETFVLSRLSSESMTVEALTQICPISQAELVRILLRLLDEEILKVAH